ncbi:MAG: hypothetical protein IPK32_01225 [Verrucomicrobiaceae bacterium]|nr:hypothetical protein [Verrucomicrobiaceae bacterium]
MICIKGPKPGKFVVVEGNRRLSALLRLRDAFDGKPASPKWKELVDGRHPSKGLFKQIPYLLAPSRDSVQAFLGFRHVTGIEPWAPSEKAKFIANMVEQGMTYDEVRRKIGSTKEAVCRNYVAHRLYLQIEEQANIPRENFEDRFSVLFLSLRTQGVKQFLHIDLNLPPDKIKEGVPQKHLKALQDFAIWLFGDDKKLPLFSDSRQVDKFGKVLESEEAIKYLRRSPTPNFEVAVRMSGGDLQEVIDLVYEAADKIEEALRIAHHHSKNAELEEASNRLGRSTKQLLKLFPNTLRTLCSDD